VLNVTPCPLKHTDWLFDVPESDAQKSISDCQKSVSMEAESVSTIFLGLNGELDIAVLLQSFQTCSQ
jgi:hypothetical protein